MKTILFLLLFVFSARADLVTNRMKAVDWYREVGGKLYNTQASTNFQDISASVDFISGSAIRLDWTKMESVYKYSSSDGNLIGGGGSYYAGQREVFRKNVVLINYPMIKTAAEGQTIKCRAMLIGNTNFEGNTLDLWDYGLPHYVDVIKSTPSHPHPAE